MTSITFKCIIPNTKGGFCIGLSTSEKIKIMMKRRKMTLKDLAENTNQSSSNLSNKLSRDNFAENEIREIASALDCEYETFFVMRDTGEKL